MTHTAHPAVRSVAHWTALPRRAGVLSVAVLTLAAVFAGPASAHPFIRGGEAPVESLTTLTLAMAHGCGSESEEGGGATTEISLEVPGWLRVVEVLDLDGWTVELETAEDGTPEVVTWTAEEAQVPAPAFDLDVVASGEPGDQRYLRVFQGCENDSYRWVGTPEDPADDPAVNLTLVAADPDAPAPPEGPAPDEPADDMADEPAEAPADAPADAPAEDAAADDAPAEDAAADDAPAEDAAADDAPAADADEPGDLPGWLVPVTVVVLLGAVAAVVLGRRGRASS